MSRFLPGRELEVIFEARQVITLLKAQLQYPYHLANSIPQSEQFANRKRIYKLACSLRNIVHQITSTDLYVDSEGLQYLCWEDAHLALKHGDAFFSDDSRNFCYRICTVPADGIQIFVSFVEIYGTAVRFGHKICAG